MIAPPPTDPHGTRRCRPGPLGAGGWTGVHGWSSSRLPGKPGPWTTLVPRKKHASLRLSARPSLEFTARPQLLLLISCLVDTWIQGREELGKWAPALHGRASDVSASVGSGGSHLTGAFLHHRHAVLHSHRPELGAGNSARTSPRPEQAIN